MATRLRLPGWPEVAADDRALLARFADERDEAAFAALVKRHGSLVLGVCKRAVRDAHFAEDAFQAVFLVLARQPHAALNASSIAGWLFGIARRIGMAASRREMRRMRRERRAAINKQLAASPDWDDLLRVVDEELTKLPEDNRAAFIACFYRERTHDEAARDLGWSVSTLRRRLERAKEMLRARLTRRGATLAAGLCAGGLAPTAVQAVPRELVKSAGQPTGASAAAIQLAALGGAKGIGQLVAIILAACGLGGIAAAIAPDQPSEAVKTIAARVPAPPAEWVAVAGRVTFPANRELPVRKEIKQTDGFVKGADCCFQDGRRLFFDNIIIDEKSRGMANVVVWLRPDSPDPNAAFPPGRIHPNLAQRPPREHTIDAIDCQFSPRITVAREGDTLLFKNSAPLATNVHYEPHDPALAEGSSLNVLLPAVTGQTKSRQPLAASAGPNHFTSSIYVWMRGYVWAFDHPYAAVTDGAGKFRIPRAPVGRWRLMMWHEDYGYSEGKLYGKPVSLADGPGGEMDFGALEFPMK
ncbi:MAG TPA: sigma-70 family RNA polymerase sigma factor [Urbifossiella sp.]|nr:sigma-70 family RNA polymerase sigma factor [Urbifossiella sp.]